MPLIELGEIPAGSSVEEPPKVRALRPRDLRWILVAAATVLCLLAVTGSAVPQPRGLRLLWRIPVASQPFITLAGDTLYLHEPGNGAALTAYDAANGNLRWRKPVKDAVDWVYTPVPGMIMLPNVVEQADGAAPSTAGACSASATAPGRRRSTRRPARGYGPAPAGTTRNRSTGAACSTSRTVTPGRAWSTSRPAGSSSRSRPAW